MTIDDNGTESVESNLESNIPTGGDDRTYIQSGGDGLAEKDEDMNEEEEDIPLKDNDHDLRSDNIEDVSRFPSHNHNLRPRFGPVPIYSYRWGSRPG